MSLAFHRLTSESLGPPPASYRTGSKWEESTLSPTLLVQKPSGKARAGSIPLVASLTGPEAMRLGALLCAGAAGMTLQVEIGFTIDTKDSGE